MIKWDRDGRLVVGGVTYQDTKALDLVHALIRRRKNIPNPKGIDVFLKALTDINTPLELIPNAGVFAPPTKDVTPVSTPVRNAGVFAEPTKDLTSDSTLAISKTPKEFYAKPSTPDGFSSDSDDEHWLFRTRPRSRSRIKRKTKRDMSVPMTPSSRRKRTIPKARSLSVKKILIGLAREEKHVYARERSTITFKNIEQIRLLTAVF